jgi:hypothetical protein
MPAVVQDGVDQPRMIQNGIARLDVTQQIDQRNLIALRTRQRPHDEVEIDCGKPRPTIRSNHRDFIMSNSRGDGKHLLDPFFCVPVFLIIVRANLPPN